MDIKLPVYKATIQDEEAGIYCISLVDDPATELDWMFFDADKQPMQFSIQDEEKRLVRGCIMECNKLIYRRDPSGYEYYIQFDEPTIRLMAQKYLKDGFQNNVDTMHNGTLEDGIELVQWFISDKEHGVNPEGFEGVADHSLFAEFHVLSDEIWESIKNKTFRGFSLSGVFNPVEVEMQKQKSNDLDEIISLIEQIKKKIK